jgi:hypothetical protein
VPIWDVKQMSDEITIVIHARNGRLLWSDFLKVIQKNVTAIRLVGDRLSESGRLEGNWRIEHIAMQSPVAVKVRYEIEGDQQAPIQWMETYAEGVKRLEGSDQQPPDFPDAAIDNFAYLAELHDRVEKIEYLLPKSQEVVALPKAAAHAVAIQKTRRPPHYKSYGELQGELGQITVHGGTSEFIIWDRLTQHRIHCRFSREHAAEVGELITKQIRVFGLISYDRKDIPVAVEVDSWKRAKGEDELATLEEIRNSMMPLPEGMSSEDFVRGLRDEEQA